MYIKDLALNNLQGLIYHKNQQTNVLGNFFVHLFAHDYMVSSIQWPGSNSNNFQIDLFGP